MKYRLLKLLLDAVSCMPFRLLYFISSGLSVILYHVIRYRRSVVRQNVAESFPEKSHAELKRIERQFYRNFTDYVVETCKMGHMSDSSIMKRMKFTNVDEVNSVLATGRSVALYLGHLFNWEWISSMPLWLEKGVVTAQIYHPLSNHDVDRIMLESRASHGATNVAMHSTARFITSLIAENKVSITGFIADQSPRRSEIQHYVPFLNHNTPVTLGTEKIARHYDFDVWFVKTRKVARGYYEATFVKMSDNPRQLAPNALTEMYYQLLQDNIMQEPALYLWTHRRFKFAEIINPVKLYAPTNCTY